MEDKRVERIGIVTLYRGYNYGTSLQAYALKYYLTQMGFETYILWTDENTHAGRDIRIGKIGRILLRMFIHPQLLVHTVCSYGKSFAADMDPEIKKSFRSFEKEYLSVQGMSRKALKKFAEDVHTVALVCGSDQIWSAAHANVEPLYYLRFAPQEKRIAYAPSFGSGVVPNYNKKVIRKYLKGFHRISVRETQAAAIVKDLVGLDVPVLLDPTLLIDWEQWIGDNANEEYIVAYFLSKPDKATVEYIACLARTQKYRVLVFPYHFEMFDSLPSVEYQQPGPKEFVNLIAHAKCVCTDSFHGTAFSIVLNTPFVAFARNYASAVEQSSRVTSLLSLMGLERCYVESDNSEHVQIPVIDYEHVNALLKSQREHAKRYLSSALRKD